MKPRIYLRPQAQIDVMELAEHIALDDVVAAIRFAEAFHASIDFLLDFPESGEIWKPKKARHAPMRIWPVKGFPNHLIFFRMTPDELQIIRVVHGARDLDGQRIH